MEFSSERFQEIIRDLEEYKESVRIKKLIFCACKKYWENDLNVLNGFALKDLVQELVDSNSTIEELTDSIYQIVKHINNQELYAMVANYILMQLGEIYIEEDQEECTLILQEGSPQNNKSKLEIEYFLEQIAWNLERDTESIRIKKLIFAICRKYWENDLIKIEKNNLKDLILESYLLYPDLQVLEESLYTIVETLNRKEVYQLIADKIITNLGILYKNKDQYLPIKKKLKNNNALHFNHKLNKKKIKFLDKKMLLNLQI
ncbi:MAG: hypothetical protein QNJ54_25940 [Prochloraceae cyanobacterium]|nr:hypothetical protein [Prochloraceae cyanobacterium]